MPTPMAAAVERRIAELDAEIATHDSSLDAVDDEIAAAVSKRALIEGLRASAVRERSEFIKVRDAAGEPEPAEPPKRQKPAAAILYLMRDGISRYPEAVIGHLPGENASSVRRALKAHVEAGRLVRAPNGAYGLPAPVAVEPVQAAAE